MKRLLMLSVVVSFSVFAGVSAFAASEAEDYYTKTCVRCHGADGAKIAANITDSAERAAKIAEILEGYQNKTQGGAQRATMEAIAKNLTNEQMNGLGSYIAGLRKE